HVWDIATGQQLHQLRGHNGPVKRVAISADSALVASIDDKSIRVWSLKTGSILRVREAKPNAIAFSPVDDVLYLGLNKDTAGTGTEHELVDAASGRSLRKLIGPYLLANASAFTRNGNLLAVSGLISGR